MDNNITTMPEKSLYDPSAYTDNELYEILDLVNPTDRELEAKILMMVHKYENGTNKPSLKLARFFNDIYNHFFDSSEDEDEYETGQTMLEGFDSSNYRLQAKENFGKTIRGEVTEQAEEIAAPPTSGGGGGGSLGGRYDDNHHHQHIKIGSAFVLPHRKVCACRGRKGAERSRTCPTNAKQ